MLDIVFKAVNNDVFIFSPGKYINPIYNGKGYKIQAFLVPEFIIAAHGS